MKLLITNLDYLKDSNPVIARVFGRSEDGTRQSILIDGTRPFFCVPSNSIIPKDYRIVSVEDGWSSLKGEPLKCIYTRIPKDVAQRVKCNICSGTGEVNKLPCPNPNCRGGQVEIGLRGKFPITFQADVVYEQVLRIYYGLVGVIDVPSNHCHISQVKSSSATILPKISVYDIETMDSVDTVKTPEPIPCLTAFDSYTNNYHVFCFGFMGHELAQVPLRLRQYWSLNPIPKLLKYNFANPIIVFHNHDTEKAMLSDFINFKKSTLPDIISPWNATFDMPYLVNRMKLLGLPYQQLSEVGNVYYRPKDETMFIESCTEIDAMNAYSDIQLQELRSKSLDYCANKEFGIGKMPRTSIKEMRQKDPVGLLAYNIVDVELTHAMNVECQLSEQRIMLGKTANVGLDNQSPLRVTESFIMSFIRDRKIALPTNVSHKRDKKKEGGAFVHDATIGLHKNVIVLDYKGYYTSVMMSLNVCASTSVTKDEIRKELLGKTIGDKLFVREEDITEIILDDIIKRFYIHTPNGAIFRKDKKGIIPEILVHVKQQRGVYKKLEKEETDPQKKNVYYLIQNGYKRIGNIFYGQFKNPHFRLMSKEIAEAITSACATLTLKTIDIIEKINLVEFVQKTNPELVPKVTNFILRVIYGDTDSLMLRLPPSLNGEEMYILGKLLEKYINSIVPNLSKEMFNNDEHYIEIEFDDKKIMPVFLQMPKKGDEEEGAKKRYAYLSYDLKSHSIDPIPKFTGMETIRSDIAPITSEVQIKVTTMVLNERPFSEIKSYIFDIYKNFTKQLPESILIKETLQRDLNSMGKSGYTSHSPQVIGALYANKYLGKSFDNGSTLYYLYLNGIPKGYPISINTAKWKEQKVKTLCLGYNEQVPKAFVPYIDWEKMKELNIESPLESILLSVGYRYDHIISEMNNVTIKRMMVMT